MWERYAEREVFNSLVSRLRATPSPPPPPSPCVKEEEIRSQTTLAAGRAEARRSCRRASKHTQVSARGSAARAASPRPPLISGARPGAHGRPFLRRRRDRDERAPLSSLVVVFSRPQRTGKIHSKLVADFILSI